LIRLSILKRDERNLKILRKNNSCDKGFLNMCGGNESGSCSLLQQHSFAQFFSV
jgi:hypothetical protein